MKRGWWLGVLLLALAARASAYEFLQGYEQAPTLAAALERVRAQPDRHVLLYFGMSEFCPPCREARAVLNSERVRERWKPHFVVVNIDLFAPTPAERQLIDEARVSWAPVLLFLDGGGKRVAYARQLRSEAEALALGDLVAKKEYAMSALGKYSAQNFKAGAAIRAATDQRIDDRPRLRDVTAQPHERIAGDALRKLLTGKRMRKENQDWFLTLDFRERNLLEAEGRRKRAAATMRGAGKWYVTKKGKLCLALTSRDVDENWCRHVFRAGGTYFLSKDLRADRTVYRMVSDGSS
jgi:thioredoxin-related protein